MVVKTKKSVKKSNPMATIKSKKHIPSDEHIGKMEVVSDYEKRLEKASQLLNDAGISDEAATDLELQDLISKMNGKKPTSKKTQKYQKRGEKKVRGGEKTSMISSNTVSKKNLLKLIQNHKSKDLDNILYLESLKRDLYDAYDESKEMITEQLKVGIELLEETIAEIRQDNAEFATTLIKNGHKEVARYVLLKKNVGRNMRRLAEKNSNK